MGTVRTFNGMRIRRGMWGNTFANPDYAHIESDGKALTVWWRDSGAYPFIYNWKQKDAVFGTDSCKTHQDMKFMGGKDREQYRKICGEFYGKLGRNFRAPINMDQRADLEEWYAKNPVMKEFQKKNGLGRLWVIDHTQFGDIGDIPDRNPGNKEEHGLWDETLGNGEKYTYVIVWWSELSPRRFKTANDDLVRIFNSISGLNVRKYIAINNNGKPELMNIDDAYVPPIKPRTEKYAVDMRQALNMHLMDTADKWENTKRFRMERDSANQQVYNHMPSKTEAEYRHMNTIGDSWNRPYRRKMKINERKNSRIPEIISIFAEF